MHRIRRPGHGSCRGDATPVLFLINGQEIPRFVLVGVAKVLPAGGSGIPANPVRTLPPKNQFVTVVPTSIFTPGKIRSNRAQTEGSVLRIVHRQQRSAVAEHMHVAWINGIGIKAGVNHPGSIDAVHSGIGNGQPENGPLRQWVRCRPIPRAGPAGGCIHCPPTPEGSGQVQQPLVHAFARIPPQERAFPLGRIGNGIHCPLAHRQFLVEQLPLTTGKRRFGDFGPRFRSG